MIGIKKNTASKLRQRMTLQQETQTADGEGGYARTWQSVADIWAEVAPLTGAQILARERLFGGQLQSEVSHRILIRYRGGVSAGNRLVFENRAFNIRYLSNIGENDEVIELLVQEGVAT